MTPEQAAKAIEAVTRYTFLEQEKNRVRQLAHHVDRSWVDNSMQISQVGQSLRTTIPDECAAEIKALINSWADRRIAEIDGLMKDIEI